MSGRLLPKSKGTLVVFLLDVFLSVVASLSIIMIIRWDVKVIPDFDVYVLRLFLAALVTSSAACLISKSYKFVVRYSSMRSLSKLAEEAFIKEVLLGICGLFDLILFKHFEHPFLILCIDFLLTFSLFIIIRVMIVSIIDNAGDDVAANVSRIRVLVYGTSEKSVAMVTRLEQSKHYIVVGLLSPNKAKQGLVIMDHEVFYIGNTKEFMAFKIEKGIEGMIFTQGADSLDNECQKYVNMALSCGIHILTTPKIEEVKIESMSYNNLKSVSDVNFIPDGMTEFERSFKRFVDLCLSAALIVVFSPLMLACAIAVSLKGGPGPVLYKQERIGRFGRPFKIYKFRTMVNDAEPNGAALYSGEDDPRLTKVGKFLRVHHLDELPQLFNVFLGEMAFVGYRPERKFYIDKIMEQDPRYAYLYQIRPGVTSYATLKNGYTDTMEKMLRRLEFDLYYLRHRSAWFDVKILWRTFTNIVFGKKF